MSETTSADALARWLADPSRPPPEDLDEDVLAAVIALRPDLAPPPRVTVDDILNGPAPAMTAPRASGGEVVPLFRRAIAAAGGLAGLGLLTATAATLFLVARPLLEEAQAPAPSASWVEDAVAQPGTAAEPPAQEAPKAQAEEAVAPPAPTLEKKQDASPQRDDRLADDSYAGAAERSAMPAPEDLDAIAAAPSAAGSSYGEGAGASPLETLRAAAVPSEGPLVASSPAKDELQSTLEGSRKSNRAESAKSVETEAPPAAAPVDAGAAEATARNHLAAGRPQDALEVLAIALQVHTSNTPWRSQLLVTQGDAWLAAGDEARAIASWEEAARLNASR